MSHNSFGRLFRFTTWGESHGPSIGCVVDGTPPKIELRTIFNFGLIKENQVKVNSLVQEKRMIKLKYSLE